MLALSGRLFAPRSRNLETVGLMKAVVGPRSSPPHPSHLFLAMPTCRSWMRIKVLQLVVQLLLHKRVQCPKCVFRPP